MTPFAYGGRRRVPEDGGYYWRITQFLWPTYAFIPAFSWPKTCTYTVPVDDHHCFRMSFTYNIEGAVDSGRWLQPGEGIGPWSRTYGQFWFDDGLPIDTWLLDQNKRNHYFMDREKQRTESYTGHRGHSHPGPRDDRRHGLHLRSDPRTPGHHRHRRDRRAARPDRHGAQSRTRASSRYAATHPDAYRLRALDVVSPDGELAPVLERYRDEVTVTA